MGKKILLKFSYTYNDKEITFPEWIKTLPEEEQQIFHEAQQNNYRWRQEAIDQGRMTMTEDNDYLWASKEEYEKNKEHDPIATEYFDRYLRENDVVFHATPIEIDDTTDVTDEK